MIVEFFGPAGSGKTTFAHALARGLRERGHVAQVVLSYKPGEYGSLLDPGGLIPALRRVMRPIYEMISMACRPRTNANAFRTAAKLVKILPPKNVLWLIRFSQYMLRLTRVWHELPISHDIMIFDQAFVQAVCSLALFNRSADAMSLSSALDATPKSDIVIRMDAPREILVTRLNDRLRRESFMERLFEADLETNLQSTKIVERVNGLLVERGHSVICVNSFDQDSINEAVRRIEDVIVKKLSFEEAVPIDRNPNEGHSCEQK